MRLKLTWDEMTLPICSIASILNISHAALIRIVQSAATIFVVVFGASQEQKRGTTAAVVVTVLARNIQEQ